MRSWWWSCNLLPGPRTCEGGTRRGDKTTKSSRDNQTENIPRVCDESLWQIWPIIFVWTSSRGTGTTKSVKLMLVEWFACFRFGKSFYSLFGSSFVISEVRLLQGTDGLTDSLEPLDWPFCLSLWEIFSTYKYHLYPSLIETSCWELCPIPI